MKRINFRTDKTSVKLLWLAALITGALKGKFSQADCDRCVVGLGKRVNGDGKLSGRPVNSFAKRFGVTGYETDALFCANYYKIDKRLGDPLNSQVTPEQAARALRRLASKYARKGN